MPWQRILCFFSTLVIHAVTDKPRKVTSPEEVGRIADGRRETFINPDAAMGRTFHVNAKQIDGLKRCFFVHVGKTIEQGPANQRSNKACASSYAREYHLGHYRRTNGGIAPTQEYTGGDTQYCHKGQKRKTTLTMVLRDQDDITASVVEPKRCIYEVTLYGSVFLLAGSDGDPLLGEGDTKPFLAGGVEDAIPTRKDRGKGAPVAKPKKKKKSGPKPANRWEKMKQEAVDLVRSTSRETLLAKPARSLQELLRNLGTPCKSCREKRDLVDKLYAVVGAQSEL